MPQTNTVTNATTVAAVKSARPAAPKKVPGAVKEAATKGKAEGAERKPAFPLTAAITVVAEANPKRPGTKAAEKWAFYKGCKTVEDVVKAFAKNNLPRRKAMSAIRWDKEHGHITVSA